MYEAIWTAAILFSMAMALLIFCSIRENAEKLQHIIEEMKANERCSECRYCIGICVNEESEYAGECREDELACPLWERKAT